MTCQANQAAATAAKPVSASIVTFNSADQIIELLHSMQTQLDLSKLEVFIVDNASTDDTVLRIEHGYPWVKLIKNQGNVGFGAAHNQIISQLHSKYHAVINPDIVFLEDSLSQLAYYLDKNSEAVMVTPRILNRDGTEQHLPKYLPTVAHLLARRVAPSSSRSRRLNLAYTRACEEFIQPTAIENATGALFVIRTEVLRNLRGFDERFFIYFEDNDLSKRAANLGQIIFYPKTAVVHGYARSSMTSFRALAHLLRSAALYFAKHGWRASRSKRTG